MSTDDKYLPKDLQKRLNEYVKTATGMERPHKSQRPLAEAFQACYWEMIKLGMVKEEYTDGEEKSSN
jgi:hypothetical protein